MKKKVYLKPVNRVIDFGDSFCGDMITVTSEVGEFDAKASNVWVDDDDLDW